LQYVFVNSLTLGTPERTWSRLHKALGLKLTAGTKLGKVEHFLQSDHVPVILVVDEMDQLLDKCQSILYSLLEWTSKPALRFCLIAIFNTMNLPEPALAARNSSRMASIEWCSRPTRTGTSSAS
jgi:Cdc6-like AAA superfamily ATPase